MSIHSINSSILGIVLITLLFYTHVLSLKPYLNKPPDKARFAVVVRTDLNLTKGQYALLTAHTTVACYKKALKEYPTGIKIWMNEGQSKVVLKASEKGNQILPALIKKAESIKLVTCATRNIANTKAGQIAVAGFGPGSASKIKKVTGQLKLF
uniref:peptidyl-tRNA hydrolase n=1 Tax=Clastoptera arizonana TaxID=38151 RepID=A0A1B6DHY1_9HEMI